MDKRGDLASLSTNTKTTIVTALGFSKALKESSGTGLHNCLYRGKNLGSELTAAQSAAIAVGTFDDMWIGDYWQKTTIYTYYEKTGDTTAQIGYYVATTATITVNWRIAAFDYYYRCGDSEFTKHHVVVVPDTTLYNAQMNSTNTTEGGYLASKMRTEHLERAKFLVNAAFGSSHVLTHREVFENAVVNGKTQGWSWQNSTVDLMNEIRVYGCKVFGGVDNSETTTDQGRFGAFTTSKSQLNLFKFRPNLMHYRNM